MSEKTRNEIAGMITNKEIEDLGAPWLSMAESPPQAYIPPLPRPYDEQRKKGADYGDTPSLFAPEGFARGSAGSLNKMRQLRPDYGVRLRYGRSF